MIDYDRNGKPGERVTISLDDGLFRCFLCGDYFHLNELREISQHVNGMVLLHHVCKRCDALEEGDTVIIDPKEGETK
jgi:hypothetical protein